MLDGDLDKIASSVLMWWILVWAALDSLSSYHCMQVITNRIWVRIVFVRPYTIKLAELKRRASLTGLLGLSLCLIVCLALLFFFPSSCDEVNCVLLDPTNFRSFRRFFHYLTSVKSRPLSLKKANSTKCICSMTSHWNIGSN